MNKIILNTLGDKVIVRKAAENGGNAGGDTGGSEMEYLDVSGFLSSMDTGNAFLVISFSTNIKFDSGNTGLTCMPPMTGLALMSLNEYMDELKQYTHAIAFYPNAINTGFLANKNATFAEEMKDVLDSEGIDYDSIPRLTKEEFYNLA